MLRTSATKRCETRVRNLVPMHFHHCANVGRIYH